MGLETCPVCGTSFETSRRGTRTERDSVDADGTTWYVVTCDTWVVHQCARCTPRIDTRPTSPPHADDTLRKASDPASPGAFVNQHTIPSSVLAILITTGIVAFIALMMWGAKTP
jgi:hypothetical protein